jgi:protein-L-isoaspartate O-methyltransferase
MHPSAILTIVNDILINERSMVVECGAGLSTLYVAKAVSMRGGRLISFESDPAWREHIHEQIEELGLGSCVELVHAELSEWRGQERKYLWYNEQVVRERLGDGPPVDLLVVDGPSGSVCYHARYPAVPVIRSYLNNRYAVILHDIGRRQEQEIVELWGQELSIEFINDYNARGVSYGRNGCYYEV